MKYRLWNLDQDYPILEKWCKARNWESKIPKEMLPPQGIIVEDKQPICALGLYLNEQVKFGYMYGIFSNPEIGKMTLFKAMKMSLKAVKELASSKNIEMIINCVRSPPWLSNRRRAESHINEHIFKRRMFCTKSKIIHQI